MNKFMRGQGVRALSYIVAVISIIAVFALIVADVYVRWNLNKDFSFLGDAPLAALIVSAFGLWVALLFAGKREE
jgi:hypothetical protein